MAKMRMEVTLGCLLTQICSAPPYIVKIVAGMIEHIYACIVFRDDLSQMFWAWHGPVGKICPTAD